MTKKIFVLLIALIGLGICANAQCVFDVTDIETADVYYGGAYTITVTVKPAFTPARAGTYTIVVVPKTEFARVLGSQRKEVTMKYDGDRWVNSIGRTIDSVNVNFRCETKDRPTCTKNDFKVDRCF